MDSLDKDNAVDLINLDLSKAFNTGKSFWKLLLKTRRLGIDSIILRWISLKRETIVVYAEREII